MEGDPRFDKAFEIAMLQKDFSSWAMRRDM